MRDADSYIVTVDVGNTSTRFGLFETETAAAATRPFRTWEITTPDRLTTDEARMHVAQVLDMLGADTGISGRLRPEAAVLSCVVPTLEAAWTVALRSSVAGKVFSVGPGLKTGMRMRYDDPSEIGPDRIADALAAREVYGAPCVVVDLGTTTNIEVVDGEGSFAGGIIAPGLALGARSLSAAAARLPMVELRAPANVIGKSTRDAMRSGVVFGEVARIDGMLDMVLAEMRAAGAAGDSPVPIVITGSRASEMAALLRHDLTPDDALTLRGLAELYRLNRKPRRA